MFTISAIWCLVTLIIQSATERNPIIRFVKFSYKLSARQPFCGVLAIFFNNALLSRVLLILLLIVKLQLIIPPAALVALKYKVIFFLE